MRLLKLGLLSGFAALVAIGSIDSAEAGQKWKFRYYDAYPEYESFYPGPIFIPPPRYLRQYDRYSSYDDDYDDEDDEFELNRLAEEEELDSFVFDEYGEGDFDESGRAPDVNPYGDPDY